MKQNKSVLYDQGFIGEKNPPAFLIGIMGKGIFGRECGTIALPEREGRISTDSSGDGSFQVKEGAGAIVSV